MLLMLATFHTRSWACDGFHGRIPYVNMGASGSSCHGASESDEGYASLPEVSHERLALLTVRVQRYVHGISMVKSQAVMCCRLTESTDGQSVTKSLSKEFLDLRGIRQGP